LKRLRDVRDLEVNFVYIFVLKQRPFLVPFLTVVAVHPNASPRYTFPVTEHWRADLIHLCAPADTSRLLFTTLELSL
jgi:hypothetical protein